MADAKVTIISKQTVQPSPRTNEGESMRRIHLTPWDLKMLPVHHIQKGVLFNRTPSTHFISNLFTSFSRALDHFYPLAGRLVSTTHDDDDDNSISISLDCTGDGAEFVHASAPGVKTSNLIAPYYVPAAIHSFFPLNGVLNYDGHDQPVLGAQVTELADGVFIACSLNHTVADGTSFWRFFNTWSAICRTGTNAMDDPPVFDRWFPDSCPVPMHLPFKDHREFITELQLPPTRECAFDFSSENIRKLKAKANEEMDCSGKKISSFQAVLAHLWRSICRARRLKPEEEITCSVLVGYRTRLSPPLPEAYFGNSIDGARTTALAGEVESKGLGWTAWQLNRSIAARGDAAALPAWFESWSKRPSFMNFVQPNVVGTSSSPRFNVYGNDFGLGRPVAVRSGPGNKFDGKMTVFPGAEEGGMTFEICLAAEALIALLQDKEFMETVAW